jgi:hypothetical protein
MTKLATNGIQTVKSLIFGATAKKYALLQNQKTENLKIV